MDKRLHDRLAKIEASIESLSEAEGAYLALEANRKPLYSKLFLLADGKNVAEKEARAYDSQDWRDFAKGHAEAEARMNHESRMYQLRLKAYDAEHLTLKHEAPAIKRQGA
jgi:hypothetical protein